MCLHGYLSSKEAFAAQTAYLSKFFKVTAIDFLGFGKAQPLAVPFSVGDYAQWLLQAMKTLGLQQPIVIAHSFGCRVAVKAAAIDKQAFDRLILTGPAGVIVGRGLAYRAKVWAYRTVKKVAPKFAEKRFGSAEYRSLPPIMKESYKRIVNEDLRETARLVENPVLLVEGTKDKVTTRKEAEIYLAHFPNARLKLMEGGHFAFAEHPTAFHLIIEEFLYE